jgi:hypothetical protein
MTERRRTIIRFLIFILLALLVAGFQTSFWYHLFGAMPAPLLWLTLIAYLSLYRDLSEGLISVYMISIVLSVFTSMPEGLFSLVALLLFFAGRFFRSRIFWPGPTYFMLICGVSVPSFYILHFLLSLYFETNPVWRPDVLRWLLQTLETTVVALLVFPFYQWIDDFMKEENKETWSLRS